jgi:hypothetical protein
MHLCPQYLTIIYEFLFPLTLALSLGGEREVLKNMFLVYRFLFFVESTNRERETSRKLFLVF